MSERREWVIDEDDESRMVVERVGLGGLWIEVQVRREGEWKATLSIGTSPRMSRALRDALNAALGDDE